ncbi:MAG: hypothetical protein CMB77_02275 [Euryarchaeota archaeon]|nr:hypothetical protein [Euryarchaeota archaeon]|tara:strand:- start:2598 stop:3386 length:789 start_codon:yes stop_codon:yes gene_type:complete
MKSLGTLNNQLSYWKGQKKTIINLEQYERFQGCKNKLEEKVRNNVMNKLVKTAMDRHGYTQASLAKDLNKPPETLNRWLKNKQQASREDILKLAELLKLPPGVVQFEPEPLVIKTTRKYLTRETITLEEPGELHLPTNFPSHFEGQRIDTTNPNSLKYGAVDIFDMQNKDKCIDERCINAWSICGAVINNKEVVLTGRLMPRSDGDTFDITGMWEVSKSQESPNYKGIVVKWACPVVIQLQKQFIDAYTDGEKNNYSNQGYS